MKSEKISAWTIAVTNIAIVIGLIFVGLEFRANTQTLEIERLDNYTQGMWENNALVASDGELASIIVKGVTAPESLSRGRILFGLKPIYLPSVAS